MKFRFAKNLRYKLAKSIGLPEIYKRLDVLEVRTGSRFSRGDLLDEVAEYEFALELRLKDYLHSGLEDVRTDVSAMQQQLFGLRDEFVGRNEQASSTLLSLIDDRVVTLQRRLEEHVTALTRFITDRSSDVTNNYKKDLQALTTEVSGLTRSIGDIRRNIRDIEGLRQATDGAKEGVARSTFSSETLSPALYQAFEDEFRGSEELIRKRQEEYLDFFSQMSDGDIIVDIGCGRGEWLELLNLRGLSGIGVDVNQVTVTRCAKKGLNVHCSDAIDFLRTREEGSVAGITLFQVIEHLDFDTLMFLLDECFRALRPGGILIAEFPNIESVEVGSSTFWLDPTHLRPLHPRLVQFLVEHHGFVASQLYYPEFEAFQTNDSTDLARAKNSPDVAIIARR